MSDFLPPSAAQIFHTFSFLSIHKNDWASISSIRGFLAETYQLEVDDAEIERIGDLLNSFGCTYKRTKDGVKYFNCRPYLDSEKAIYFADGTIIYCPTTESKKSWALIMGERQIRERLPQF